MAISRSCSRSSDDGHCTAGERSTTNECTIGHDDGLTGLVVGDRQGHVGSTSFPADVVIYLSTHSAGIPAPAAEQGAGGSSSPTLQAARKAVAARSMKCVFMVGSKAVRCVTCGERRLQRNQRKGVRSRGGTAGSALPPCLNPSSRYTTVHSVAPLPRSRLPWSARMPPLSPPEPAPCRRRRTPACRTYAAVLRNFYPGARMDPQSCGGRHGERAGENHVPARFRACEHFRLWSSPWRTGSVSARSFQLHLLMQRQDWEYQT